MPRKGSKKKVDKLSTSLSKCHVTPEKPEEAEGEASGSVEKLVFDEELSPEVEAKWPRVKPIVPAIFIHNPCDFSTHFVKVIEMGVQLYHPIRGCNFTKVIVGSMDDHKLFIQYLDDQHFPYHTYGAPEKKKLKVVIRGLPKDTDLDKLKHDLISYSVPVIRLHQMKTKVFKTKRLIKKMKAKREKIMVLVVVPHDEEGRKLLRLKKVLDHNVTIERPITKPKQCHRCQKWGHTQRNCHGEARCVKCGESHYSYKCIKNPKKLNPKCANCGGPHTASYRKCTHCPASDEYKKTQLSKCKKPISMAPRHFFSMR